MSFGMLRPQTQEFQSTPSARRATAREQGKGAYLMISIHALREESDWRTSLGTASVAYFNPRPPRGERRFHEDNMLFVVDISIHALREESDL